MVASFSSQMRRVLTVLCEDPGSARLTPSAFCMAPWSMRSRVPKDESSEGLVDIDDDEVVSSESASAVKKMRKAWADLNPLKGVGTENAITYALTCKGRGLPPSVRVQQKPPAPAPCAARGRAGGKGEKSQGAEGEELGGMIYCRRACC
eukprot:5434688-Pleurochrysis_carterae.AAC.1